MARNWPFILVLIAGILILIQGLVALGTYAFAPSVIQNLTSISGLNGTSASSGVLNATGFSNATSLIRLAILIESVIIFIEAALLLLAAAKIRNAPPGTVKGWLIAALVISLLSALTGGGLLWIGTVLGIVGSAMGLAAKPGQQAPAEATTPPSAQTSSRKRRARKSG